MKKLIYSVFFSCLSTLAPSLFYGQCPNDNVQYPSTTFDLVNNATLTEPCHYGGEYSLWTVCSGATYVWSTCGDDDWDTQISLYNNSTGVILGYNDDFCGTFGLSSSITWTANFSGTVRVLVDEFNCLDNAGPCMTLVGSRVSACGGGGIANDPCTGAIAVTCGSVTTGTTSGATIQAGVACGGGSAPDVWYTVMGVGGNMTASLCTGTSYDTWISVLTGPCNTLNCIANNDDMCGLQSSVNWLSIAGTTYYIMVHGFSTNSGAFQLTVTGNPTTTFTGLNPSYCTGAQSSVLVGNPSGGTFSGTGIVGNTFDPDIAGPGLHAITYTNGSGPCAGVTTQNTYVSVSPTANAGPDLSFCWGLSDTITATVSGAASYSWNPVAGLSNPNILNPIASPSTTTPYVLTAVSAPGGLGAIDVSQPVSNAYMADFNQGDLAQSFTTTETDLCGASVKLEPTVGSGMANITIQLYTNLPNAGGTLLGSGTANGIAPGGTATVTWPMAAVTTGSTYYLVFTSSDLNFGLTGDLNNTYTGGNLYANTGYQPFLQYDYTFKTFSCASGCTSTDTVVVNVNPPPDSTFTGLQNTICENEPAVTLTPAVPGGTFSGTGVSGNTFDPGVSGVGNFAISYAVSAGGCSSNSTQNVTVAAQPTASFSGLDSAYCADAAVATLIGSPAGGTFSGSGVTGNSFDPTSSSTGIVIVSYDYTDSLTGCSNTSSVTTNVHALPAVAVALATDTICEDDAPVTLSGGSPSGGTYSGNGVTAGVFNPATAGGGSHTITYSFTDANGCFGEATDILFVDICTSINDPYQSSGWELYPNPARDMITIKWIGNGQKEGTVAVLDVTGKIILKAKPLKLNSGSGSELQIADLSHGVYFMEVRTGDGVERFKFVKE